MLPEVDISDNIQLETLRCLSNPSRLPKEAPISTTMDERRAANRGFYRRRIVQLTKDMSRGSYPTAGLETAYKAYADACVRHFQDVDTRDIIQSTYEGMTTSKAAPAGGGNAYKPRDDLEMLGKAIQTGGMDAFVKRKTSVGSSQERFPEVRRVNLRAAGLRTKGTAVRAERRVHFADQSADNNV